MPIREIPSVRKARFQSTIADLRAVVGGGRLPAEKRDGAARFLEALGRVLGGEAPACDHLNYLIAGAEVEVENRARAAA